MRRLVIKSYQTPDILMHPIIQRPTKMLLSTPCTSSGWWHVSPLLSQRKSLGPWRCFVSKMNILTLQVPSCVSQNSRDIQNLWFLLIFQATFQLGEFHGVLLLGTILESHQFTEHLGCKRKKSGTQKKSFRKDGSNLKHVGYASKLRWLRKLR